MDGTQQHQRARCADEDAEEPVDAAQLRMGLGLFLIAMLVFRPSPRGQIYDSSYALLVSHQLITSGDPSLDVWVATLGGVDGNGRPHDYRIVSSGGCVPSSSRAS